MTPDWTTVNYSYKNIRHYPTATPGVPSGYVEEGWALRHRIIVLEREQTELAAVVDGFVGQPGGELAAAELAAIERRLAAAIGRREELRSLLTGYGLAAPQVSELLDG